MAIRFGLFLAMLLAVFCGAPGAGAGELRVYIGTYTRGESRGIYLSRLDLATGKLQPPELAAETKNPSFLAIHPSRP